MSATADPGTARAANKREAAQDRAGPIDLTVVRQSVDELVALYVRKDDAAASFKDAIDAIAAKGGVSKKALKAYITARVKEKMPETHAGATQLCLLFENV